MISQELLEEIEDGVKKLPSDIGKRNNIIEELTTIPPGEYEYHIINWLMKKNKDTEHVMQIRDGLIYLAAKCETKEDARTLGQNLANWGRHFGIYGYRYYSVFFLTLANVLYFKFGILEPE